MDRSPTAADVASGKASTTPRRGKADWSCVDSKSFLPELERQLMQGVHMSCPWHFPAPVP